MIRWLWSLAVATTLIGPSIAQAENRFAFVVGNDTYQNVDPLKKAVNDARSIAQWSRPSALRSRWARI